MFALIMFSNKGDRHSHLNHLLHRTLEISRIFLSTQRCYIQFCTWMSLFKGKFIWFCSRNLFFFIFYFHNGLLRLLWNFVIGQFLSTSRLSSFRKNGKCLKVVLAKGKKWNIDDFQPCHSQKNDNWINPTKFNGVRSQLYRVIQKQCFYII